MKSTPLPSALFTRNRGKLVGLLSPGAVAMVGSNEQMHRNGDQYFPFRQHSDFFYLTGIGQPESILILSPGHHEPEFREILFIQKPTPRSKVWFGPGLSKEAASERSGIGTVMWLEELDGTVEKLFPDAARLYFSGATVEAKYMGKFPDQNPSPLSPLLTGLRMVKEFEEVEEIKKAAHITHSAFRRVLGMIRPGIREYEVEAEIIAEFLRMGAEGHAYDPIVASGENALVLHYIQNNGQCNKGDLLLMDFGAEVNNYAADCSRTVPVQGRFTERQRKIYKAVLKVYRKAVNLMVPGTVMNELNEQVGTLWEEEHIALGLYSLKEARENSGDEPLWKRYFMHGISHSLGLDVHDPFERTRPFESGMVLTCEPGIYIREEGIGIRLENDILITDTGPVDLMEDFPVEAEEIEGMMQSNV